MECPSSAAVAFQSAALDDRIIAQGLRAAFSTAATAYRPPVAERVYAHLTGRRGHPRAIGEHLTALGRRGCIDVPSSCTRCPMQLFCATGRTVLEPVARAVPFIDVFAGAGGFSLGFESLGFSPVLAIDNDPAAMTTYAFNRPRARLRALVANARDLCDDRSVRGSAALTIGGPPCQSFSNANRQRHAADARHELVGIFLEAARTIGSTVFVMENVAGIRAQDEVVAAFSERSGYTVMRHELDTADVGVPQRRKRVFVFGVRTRTARQRTHVERVFREAVAAALPFTTAVLGDAIDDLPRVRVPSRRNATDADSHEVGFVVAAPPSAAQSEYVRSINGSRDMLFLLNHRAKYLNERDREIYRLLRPGDRSDAAAIAHIMPYAHRAHIFRDKFYRLRASELSKTITAHMYYDTHMYVHPRQARGLTPREAARVQGFPDDYFFLGRPNEWYRQVGNAVSPPVAREVARIATSLLAAAGESVPA